MYALWGGGGEREREERKWAMCWLQEISLQQNGPKHLKGYKR